MEKINYPSKVDIKNFNKNNNKVLYGLPDTVAFCKKCVISNQRPVSTIEFKNNQKEKKKQFILTKMVFVTLVIMRKEKKPLTGMNAVKN